MKKPIDPLLYPSLPPLITIKELQEQEWKIRDENSIYKNFNNSTVYITKVTSIIGDSYKIDVETPNCSHIIQLNYTDSLHDAIQQAEKYYYD
jgi:hypothetical protein